MLLKKELGNCGFLGIFQVATSALAVRRFHHSPRSHPQGILKEYVAEHHKTSPNSSMYGTGSTVQLHTVSLVDPDPVGSEIWEDPDPGEIIPDPIKTLKS
jgi:hypothetical protein